MESSLGDVPRAIENMTGEIEKRELSSIKNWTED